MSHNVDSDGNVWSSSLEENPVSNARRLTRLLPIPLSPSLSYLIQADFLKLLDHLRRTPLGVYFRLAYDRPP